MQKWNRIVIHHSASNWGSARVIDIWHRKRKWSGIGYHFVILNGYLTPEDAVEHRRFTSLLGSIEAGRQLDKDKWAESNEQGAHALGYNRDSIGICLIHKHGPYPIIMLAQLSLLVSELMCAFDITPESVVGHYELDRAKPECPGIDMAVFREEQLLCR